MYIVAIAWMYVALMMAVAEATNSNGSVLGAIVTFILYGLLPISLVVYLMRSPGRKRAIKEKEAKDAKVAELEAQSIKAADASNSTDPNSINPDTGSHTTRATQADSVSPVREKP